MSENKENKLSVFGIDSAELEEAVLRARELPKKTPINPSVVFIQVGNNCEQIGYVENFYAGAKEPSNDGE